MAHKKKAHQKEHEHPHKKHHGHKHEGHHEAIKAKMAEHHHKGK